MFKKLRPYQSQLKQDVVKEIKNGHYKIIAELATGGGKTVTFSDIVNNAIKKGKKVLVLVDRKELFNQCKKTLSDKATVYMVETLYRRLNSVDLHDFDMVIVDEAHKRCFDKILKLLKPTTYVLGFTGTPHRDGKKDHLKEVYTTIVNGVEIEYLIENGYLARPHYYSTGVDLTGVKQTAGDYDRKGVAKMYQEKKVYKGVLDNYEKICNNEKTIIFCSTVESSKELVEAFVNKGYSAKHLDAKSKDREQILTWFAETENAILSNVGILNTGFDEPTIKNVILYRVTRSLPLYLQMVGRGSRTTATKNEFRILDFGNNITRFGFWHVSRTWSLDVPKPKPLGSAVLKNCKGCESFINASASICHSCGYKYEKLIKEQEIAILQKLDPRELRKQALSGGVKKMVDYSKAGLVSSKWCLHSLTKLEDVKLFCKLMKYKPGFIQKNKSRYKWK